MIKGVVNLKKHKIIMTGGGSAGHVTPNLALVPLLEKQGFEIKYIGSKDGIEKDIITKAKIPYYGISSGKLRRYFDLKNFSDPFKVIKGIGDALKVIRKEKPDVIFSKGGFVSVPVVIAAHLKKVPVVSHESDMTPGLANKLATPFCNKICVTFPETVKYISGDRAVVTGTPIREEVLKGDKAKGKKIAGFSDDKPILLLIGGSLGSKFLNDTLRSTLPRILKEMNVIHICGKGNLDSSLNNKKGYKQFEYISEELPHIFAVADFIISRSGANSIFEILALRKPNLLVPLSRNASRGDQILNSKSFEKLGFSKVIEEEQLTSDSLMAALEDLKKNRNTFIKNMEKSEYSNGNEKILKVIMNAIKR